MREAELAAQPVTTGTSPAAACAASAYIYNKKQQLPYRGGGVQALAAEELARPDASHAVWPYRSSRSSGDSVSVSSALSAARRGGAGGATKRRTGDASAR